jgi:hypothetical protein
MSKQWKWKCFEARYNPTFWVLPVAIGLDFAKCPDAGIVVGRSSAGIGIKVLDPVDGFKDNVRLFDPEEGFVYRPRRDPTGRGWLWVWPPRES